MQNNQLLQSVVQVKILVAEPRSCPLLNHDSGLNVLVLGCFLGEERISLSPECLEVLVHALPRAPGHITSMIIVLCNSLAPRPLFSITGSWSGSQGRTAGGKCNSETKPNGKCRKRVYVLKMVTSDVFTSKYSCQHAALLAEAVSELSMPWSWPTWGNVVVLGLSYGSRELPWGLVAL